MKHSRILKNLILISTLISLAGCASSPPDTGGAGSQAVSEAQSGQSVRTGASGDERGGDRGGERGADSGVAAAPGGQARENGSREIPPLSDDLAAEIEYGNFPRDILNRVIVAELAGQRGLNQTALEEYLSLARDSSDIGIIKRAARIAVFLRNMPAAIEMTDLWLEQEPGSQVAVQTQALQLLSVGRFRDSLQYFARLQEMGQDIDFRMISNRAQNNREAELVMDELIADLENLRVTHPESFTLRIALADLYQQNGQHREAWNLISPLTEDIENANIDMLVLDIALLEEMGESRQAERKLQRSLRFHSDSKQLRFQYGRKLVEEERYRDAMEQFQIIVEQYPDDFDMLYSLALISLEANRYDAARDYLERLIGNHAHEDDAHYYLALIHDQDGNVERAVSHYLQVEDGSNYMPAQRKVTELLVRENRYDEASARLETVRFRNPEYNIELLSMEANALMGAQMHAEALDFLNSAIGAFPDNLQLLFLRSVVSQDLNNLALMEQDLRRIIILNPNNPVAYNSLGYTLADRTDRYEEAYELIRRAVELAPNDPAIIDSLGWVQYRLGLYEEAEENLRLAFELYPDHEVAAHLGEVLWVMGERREAERIWEEALKSEPSSEIILEAMERLTSDRST